ncbi:MAG: restriction endonuclease subunit S [Gammaproteobacteria bacterium]|nr:restriction endonuclease subunit S [Gammaproteobacteria bacterium]
MAKYQRYAEYKDSGVEWLGDIPSHWDMWKLSHAYNEIGSGTTPSTSNEENFEGDIAWITTGELRENVILDTKKKVSKKTIDQFPTLKKYPVGSVAIAMYGATIGRLGIFGIEATTNQACCVMTTSNVLNNKYLFYWLQAFKNEIIQLSSGGGQPNINQEKVASLKVSAPLIEDQIQIANFLDHETAKIDSLIEKQQKLIELLKEKRQAVISHAVTKGLNPDVPMKDSGVEWLGKIPSHWKTVFLKMIVDVRDGTHDTPAYVEPTIKSYPLVTSKDVTSGWIDLSECKHISESDYRSIIKRSKVSKGDILMPMIGTVGSPVIVKDELEIAIKNLALFRTSDENLKIYNKFLYYFLNSDECNIQFILEGRGGVQNFVSLGTLRNLQLPYLSLNEQIEIADFLDHETTEIDKLINKVKQQIQLMQERRTALISAAVTGKIDVRNWQAPNATEREMEVST